MVYLLQATQKNIIRDIEETKRREPITVGLPVESGGGMKRLRKYPIKVLSCTTPHIIIAHIVGETVKRGLLNADG